MLSLCTFTLALCSIVYELLLGQILSAFLGNTVLRYSVTIGLYMASMGVGALLAKRRVLEKPLYSLQAVELALSLIGAGSLSLLFMIHSIGIDGIVFSLFAHSLIIVIGLLTGLELPLLFAVGKAARGSDRNIVLGVDYIGAFAGTLLFAFVLYPELGLFAASFLIASLNAITGVALLIFRLRSKEQKLSSSPTMLVLQSLVVIGCVLGFQYSAEINAFWINTYVS